MWLPEPPPLTIPTGMPSASMSRRDSTRPAIASTVWRFFSSFGQAVRVWPS